MARRRTIIIGIGDVKKSLGILERVPQAAVTGAARKGMRIAYYDARSKAPKKSGDLKKGINFYKEKKVKKGKAVFAVSFDKSYNSIFQSTSKSGKRAYYPASQEYGFETRNGGYVQGRHFLKKSMEQNYTNIKRTVEDEMLKRIDKAIEKAEKRKASRP